MLAHDAPKSTLPNWGKISLPEYLDYNRSGDGWDNDVIAWHVTTRQNLQSILDNGLRANNCSNWSSAGYDRPDAVYMFCARSVVDANVPHLLDNPEDAVILTIIIPSQHVGKLHIDNLYNMSIEDADMSAIQYRGDIPADWIQLT